MSERERERPRSKNGGLISCKMAGSRNGEKEETTKTRKKLRGGIHRRGKGKKESGSEEIK